MKTYSAGKTIALRQLVRPITQQMIAAGLTGLLRNDSSHQREETEELLKIE